MILLELDSCKQCLCVILTVFHLLFFCSRVRENRESQPETLQMHLEARFEQLQVRKELDFEQNISAERAFM